MFFPFISSCELPLLHTLPTYLLLPKPMQVKGKRDGGEFIFNFQLGKFRENSSVQKCRFT